MSRLGPERECLLSLSRHCRLEVADNVARINAGLLQKHIGQTVRLTAKVLKLNGETATVEASDGGQVSLS